MKRQTRIIILILIFPFLSFAQGDPLPSWNDDTLKASIIQFVKDISAEDSPKFIPPADRIATFDNDGTLWSEKPIIESLFMIYRAKQMIAKKPSIKTRQPYKAIAAGDLNFLRTMPEKDLVRFYIETHADLTAAEFNKEAKAFFETAKAPGGKDIPGMIYKPQVELLEFLRVNGFKVFICSGGDVDFIRVISQEYYGIPPEQVIGSSSKYVYRDSSGVNDLYRTAVLATFNDKQQKPSSIQLLIGKRPVFACGNVGNGGDIYMLRFSQGGSYPSYQLMINHNDSEREFSYKEKDNKSLSWAAKYGWHVLSMKDHWKIIFPGN